MVLIEYEKKIKKEKERKAASKMIRNDDNN